VHERNLRSRRVDGCPRLRDVGQRLATEGSTEVAEEDDAGWTLTRERFEQRIGRVSDRGHLQANRLTAGCGDLVIDLQIL